MAAQRRPGAFRAPDAAGATVGQVLNAKLESVEDRLDSLDTSMKTVAESLVTLVRLEERHGATANEVARIGGQIIDHHKRIENIEREIPPLKEVRKWVVMGLLGISAMVGVGALNAFFNYQGTLELQKHTVQGINAATALPKAAEKVEAAK